MHTAVSEFASAPACAFTLTPDGEFVTPSDDPEFKKFVEQARKIVFNLEEPTTVPDTPVAPVPVASAQDDTLTSPQIAVLDRQMSQSAPILFTRDQLKNDPAVILAAVCTPLPEDVPSFNPDDDDYDGFSSFDPDNEDDENAVEDAVEDDDSTIPHQLPALRRQFCSDKHVYALALLFYANRNSPKDAPAYKYVWMAGMSSSDVVKQWYLDAENNDYEFVGTVEELMQKIQGVYVLKH